MGKTEEDAPLEDFRQGDLRHSAVLVDLDELKKIVNKKVINVIDHSTIEKEIPWFRDKQPSTEHMVIWMWEQIEPELEDTTLHRIRLQETPTIYTDYYGPSSE